MAKKPFSKNEEFFDNNATFYDVPEYEGDLFFKSFIRKNNSSLLDIGGGSGTFAELIKKECPLINVTVLDPSRVLMNKIKDSDIKQIQGSLPRLAALPLDAHYDYIHLKDVLHHVVGGSISDTNKILRESFGSMKQHLNPGGILLVQELYYESHLFSKFTRSVIFYALLLQSKLKIRIPVKEFLIGLEVCFHTRKEFRKIAEECGLELICQKDISWSNTLKKKVLLLNNWGAMLFVFKRKEEK